MLKDTIKALTTRYRRRASMHIPKIALALGVLSAVVSPFASASAAQEPGVRISAARANAIRECSVSAAKYTEYAWGDVEIYIYRTCMFNHGQPE
jgi:hypothetical protein